MKSSENPNMSYYPFTAVVEKDADLSSGEGVSISVDGLRVTVGIRFTWNRCS